MLDQNDYIHKLISGKLGENRKHSEVINKILAGYIDSDGCISLVLTGQGRVKISLTLSQAAVNDPDFEILRAFHKFYGIGSILFRVSENERDASRCDWRLGVNDTKKMFNLIGKHLVVKGQRLKESLKIYEEFKGRDLSEEEQALFKTKRSLLSSVSKPLKRKKHPSWAWLAGYIAGDGHLCCRLGRTRDKFDKKVEKFYKMTYNELYVVQVSDVVEPLEFLMEHFNGSIYQKKHGCYQWKRSLGKGNKCFSENFLRKIKPYMLHPKKYKTIGRMLKHLEGLAETKQVDA